MQLVLNTMFTLIPTFHCILPWDLRLIYFLILSMKNVEFPHRVYNSKFRCTKMVGKRYRCENKLIAKVATEPRLPPAPAPFLSLSRAGPVRHIIVYPRVHVLRGPPREVRAPLDPASPVLSASLPPCCCDSPQNFWCQQAHSLSSSLSLSFFRSPPRSFSPFISAGKKLKQHLLTSGDEPSDILFPNYWQKEREKTLQSLLMPRDTKPR